MRRRHVLLLALLACLGGGTPAPAGEAQTTHASTVVSAPGTGSSERVAVAGVAGGGALAVHVQYRRGATDLVVDRIGADGTVTGRRRLTRELTFAFDVATGGGRSAIAWGTRDGVRLVGVDASGRLGPARRIADGPANSVRVALDDRGRATVVWRRSAGVSAQELLAVRERRPADAGSVAVVDRERDDGGGQPLVAASGRTLVGWTTDRGPRLYVARGPAAPLRPIRGIPTSGRSQLDGAVALPNGDVLIVSGSRGRRLLRRVSSTRAAVEDGFDLLPPRTRLAAAPDGSIALGWTTASAVQVITAAPGRRAIGPRAVLTGRFTAPEIVAAEGGTFAAAVTDPFTGEAQRGSFPPGPLRVLWPGSASSMVIGSVGRDFGPSVEIATDGRGSTFFVWSDPAVGLRAAVRR